MNKYWFLIAWLLPVSLWSQNTRLSSSDIYKELKKLENTTTVMYLAAHPDDENTRLISWLTNHENVRTVYLRCIDFPGTASAISPGKVHGSIGPRIISEKGLN